MTKTTWWSTMSDIDGKTYYFKRDSRGKVHRVSKDIYQAHLKQDVPKFEDDGKTLSGPRYWTVGTTGKNGESEFVVMRKVSGDSNVYTLDPNDIHGDLAHDAAAMKRIGSIINKHKATLRATDPHAEIPEQVTYNLNSALALSMPDMMKSLTMSVPTISADATNTAAAFNLPYSTLNLTPINQIYIPTSSIQRRTCMDQAKAKSVASQYIPDDDKSFNACMDNDCNYVLTIQDFDNLAYKSTEKILSIAPNLYPKLTDHWPCNDNKSSYWLYNVMGLKKISEDDKNNAIIKQKINASAKDIVNQATHLNIYLGKKENEKFTYKDFLMKADNTVVFWSCSNHAYFHTPDKAWPAGMGLTLPPNNNNQGIPGTFIIAARLNSDAISSDIED